MYCVLCILWCILWASGPEINVILSYLSLHMAYHKMLCCFNYLLQTFADRIMGSFKWFVPIFVSLSAMGAVNGDFLGNSRSVSALPVLKLSAHHPVVYSVV